MDRILHTYFRSSSAYRVRIALNFKGLDARHVPIHLTRGGGEQFTDEYHALNPLRLVPVLTEDDLQLSQSLAIIEYLEERYPSPSLFPTSLDDRARVRQLALTIACEIHPLNNLRILKYLTGKLGLSDEVKLEWISHWIRLGFEALETEVKASSSNAQVCVGTAPTLADCCLIPQVFNAQRFGVDLSTYPTLLAIHRHCMELPAFEAAHPAKQPDSE